VRNILLFLGIKFVRPVKIYMDNQSAIELCKTLKSNANTRHLLVRIHFIRLCINLKIIEVLFIGTEWNVADVLTKALSLELHNRHINRLLKGFEGDRNNIHSSAVAFNAVEESLVVRGHEATMLSLANSFVT